MTTDRGGPASPAPGRNVELKATDPDPPRTLAACLELGACDHGVIVQRDTYFTVREGGLKLRVETPGRPHLIAFRRDDAARPRLSEYHVVELSDAAGMRAALAATLGIRADVAKRRHLLLWQDVRIHLDDVDGLGRFLELEAVAAPGSDLAREHRLVAELRAALQITDDRLCATGYAGRVPAPGGG